MAANTFTTQAAVGNREDLAEIIYDTSPTDTPVMSAADKVKATGTMHEWQRDVLAAPAANAVVEGSDAANVALVATQRLNNICQISRKAFSISDTQETVKKAGRSSEIRRTTLRKMLELKKDIELGLIENATSVSSGTRQTRGLRGWIQTNNSLGASGVAPNPVTNVAPTDGTLRTFTEALLQAVALSAYNNGSNFDTLILAPAMKQKVSSTFTGNSATRYQQADNRTLSAVYDFYVTDFGKVKLVPNRVMSRTREAYLLDFDMIGYAVLRDFKDEELARTGAARNFMIETEYCLEVREERGLGCIRDIQ